MFGGNKDPPLEPKTRLKLFMAAHWRGVMCVVVPAILVPIILLPMPPEHWQWCAYCLLLMAVFWVSECIPLAVTSFLPVLIFPLTGLMSTVETCQCYVSDAVMMFLGSLILAYAVEQSGLHKRLAYCAIRLIGYSHYKLLLAMCIVTTFVSMWITNTAATTMMVPINFALLRVFEEQNILSVYEKGSEKVASDITTCYFCAASFSATIGGIGTLVGTATNLAFKGLFMSEFKTAPEYLSFPKFSAFAVPYMILLEICLYFYLCIVYFGMFRPSSPAAKSSKISEQGKVAAKRTIDANWKEMGGLTFWETMVILLFGGAIIMFFCRSPQIFTGWGDIIADHFSISNNKFVQDSACAMLTAFLMFLLPSSMQICKNFTAKFHEDLPKKPASSVLLWKPMNANMPFSFMFLLGGGFALSRAAKISGLNEKIGEVLSSLKVLPNIIVIFLVALCVILTTNFASNVAVCNVFGPIAMQLALQIDQNPLWYIITAGYSASFCFMIPVGTPGNLVIQSAAGIPTKKMIKAGVGPTVTTVLITWIMVCFYAPVIWPDITTMPSWAKEGSSAADAPPPAGG